MSSSPIHLPVRQDTSPKRAEEIRNWLQVEAIWNTIAKTMTAAHDLDEVLTTVIQVINAKMHVETGSVLLREPDSDDLVFAKILRGEEEMLAPIRLKLGQGVVGWVAQTGQSVIIPDVAKDTRWFAGVDRQTGFITRSILCVPLKVKNEIIGVIELLNKLGGEFSSYDLNLLESVAAPVAVAIQNARLHHQVQTHIDQVSTLFHQVAHAKKEWEQTVDAIDKGISLQDAHSFILRANSSLAAWIGVAPTDLVGQLCCKVIHNLDALPDYCPNAIAQRGQTVSAEFYEARLGRTCLCTAYPFRDARGAVTGTVNVLKDITKEKELSAQLIQSEKLAAIGQLSASLAHEINNPLQAIQGCLELAQIKTSDAPQHDKYLLLAKNELKRLKTIVDRMADFNRPVEVEWASVNLCALAEDVIVLCAKRMEQANITVRKEWLKRACVVHGISNHLKQVFLNLILNAIDCMPNGGTLTVRSCARQQHGVWLTIEFSDTGSGIAATDLEKIFEPFYTTKPTGTGLGLPLCRTILDSHNGRLTVESEPGAGSTFTIWLPAP